MRPALFLMGTLLLPPALVVPAAAQDLLVSGYNSNEVHRYDLDSGAVQTGLTGLANPHGTCYGPDGRLYVVTEGDHSVRRFDADTLQLIDVFIADDLSTPAIDESGGLNGPTGMAFGPEGHCYLCSFESDEVKEYDAQGVYLGDFVSAGSGGLNGPDAGICFGPDGDCYVPSYWTNQVLRYEGQSGAFRGVFVAAGEGGMSRPRTLRWRSDGMLLASGEGSGGVLRYDLDGNFVDQFISMNAPTGFALHPASGNVYVTSVTRNNVRRYDGSSGQLIDTVVPSGRGGLDASVFLNFRPDPDLRLDRPRPGVAGQVNTLEVHRALPSRPLLLAIGSRNGSLRIDTRRHAYLGIADARFFLLRADAQGEVAVGGFVDPALAGATLFFQALEVGPTRVSNLVQQTF